MTTSSRTTTPAASPTLANGEPRLTDAQLDYMRYELAAELPHLSISVEWDADDADVLRIAAVPA